MEGRNVRYKKGVYYIQVHFLCFTVLPCFSLFRIKGKKLLEKSILGFFLLLPGKKEKKKKEGKSSAIGKNIFRCRRSIASVYL